MRRALDLRRLRYFLAIAERGSMSAAARGLNLAQPALSYHMSEMERLLDQPLFERNHDGMGLTEAGRVLRRHAEEIVARTDAAEQAMADFRARPATRIRLAVISSLAADLTPLLVEAVARMRPDYRLQISEAGTRDIQRKIARGEADMAVYLSGALDPGGLPLVTEPLVFLSPATGTAFTGDIAMREVARHRLVLPAPGNPLRDFLDDVAHRQALAFDIAVEIDGLRSRQNAVLRGMGCTIIGAHSIASEGVDASLCVRAIVAPRLFRPIYLGVRRNFDPAIVTTMSAALRAALAALGLEPETPTRPDVLAGAID